MNYHNKFSVKKHLQKDSENSLIAGVCAGISDYYQIPRFVIRGVTLVCFITLPKLVAIAYVVAAFCLSKKP